MEIRATALAAKFCVARGNDTNKAKRVTQNFSQLSASFLSGISLLCGLT